jgi:carbon starvation protein CstA
MDEDKLKDAQRQRSNFWLAFSSLCAAGCILTSIITSNKVQRYKAQQREHSRQQQEFQRSMDKALRP